MFLANNKILPIDSPKLMSIPSPRILFVHDCSFEAPIMCCTALQKARNHLWKDFLNLKKYYIIMLEKNYIIKLEKNYIIKLEKNYIIKLEKKNAFSHMR